MDFWNENVILSIAKQFLAGAPIKSIDFMLSTPATNLGELVDKSWQQRLLQSTVKNPLVLRYPPSSNYQRLFIKSLLAKLEFNGLEVAEEMYELYTSLMQAASKDEDYSFKIYCLTPELNVILKESTSLVSQGTTGLVTWQAAKALAEWCAENKYHLNGKNVLELGCGIGLTGIVVCKACNPSKYCFTDFHPQVLDLLRHNLNINFGDVGDEANASMLSENDLYVWQSTQVSLTPFHWDDDSAIEAILQNSKPDVILAADVIYDTTIIPCLAKVLKFFLKNVTPHDHASSTTAYISCTLRNEDTLKAFYEEVGKYSKSISKFSLIDSSRCTKDIGNLVAFMINGS